MYSSIPIKLCFFQLFLQQPLFQGYLARTLEPRIPLGFFGNEVTCLPRVCYLLWTLKLLSRPFIARVSKLPSSRSPNTRDVHRSTPRQVPYKDLIKIIKLSRSTRVLASEQT